ncbi:DUF4136 domain-containing protein [Paraglaciecola sp. 2405UD69-4]|uniref:DUF4136 domain-containing protein n=1 Tax=Paraglaciecola sp. 2405UD69-4 TaxID=3391836 RepID=UPI0039C8EF8C
MKHTFLLLMVSVICLGCSTTRQIDYDKTVSFSNINSFSLDQPIESPDQLRSTLISNSIEQNLISKGLNKTETAQGDIDVSYFAVTSTEPNRSSFSIGLGTGIGGRSGGISLGSILSLPLGKQEIIYQSLRIDIQQGDKIIWSGIDEIEIDSGNSVELQTKIGELVESILRSFPPTPKS